MTEKLLNYDIAAALIFTTLIISIIMRRMFHGRVNRVFLETITVMYLSVFFDVMAVYFDNVHEPNMFIREFTHEGYLITHLASIPFYVTYLVVLSDTLHKFSSSKTKLFMTMAPLLFVELLVFLNPINHKIFSIENTNYVRGPWFLALYFCAAYYFVYGFVYIYKYSVYFEKGQKAPLFLVFPTSLLALLAQFFFPDLLIEMLVLAICMLFVLLMVHKPDERIHSGTKLKNIASYDFEIQRSMNSFKPIHIVMINLTEYHSMLSVIPQLELQNVIRKIADKLTSENSKRRLDASIYYIEQGRFRVAIDTEKDEQAHQFANDIRAYLNEEITNYLQEMPVKTVVCIVDCPVDIDTYNDLFSFGYYLNSLENTENAIEAAEILNDKKYDLMKNMDSILQNALANRHFEVYYQPIYSVTEGRFNSAEALLRLNDKVHAFIPPDIFIPAAEENGLINKIGALVFDEVCRFIASDEYKSLGLDYIEVNLSVKQCIQPDLASSLLATMEKYDVKPDQINLEITETAAASIHNTMMKNIKDLTDAGITFSLDDYGTGYSNIKRISTLPLDIIKLDRTFTELTNDKLNIVVKNTVRMIKDMDMKIVVEGVETKEMLEHFSNLNCDYIQGYYFSKPLPKGQFVNFIKEKIETA